MEIKNTQAIGLRTRFFKNNLNLFIFFTASFLIGINFYTSFTTLSLYVFELGGNEFHSGLQSTVFLAAAVLFRFYFGPLADIKGAKVPLLIAAFVFCTAPLLFLVCNNVWTLILVRIYQAIGLASFFSSASAFVSDMAPQGRLGTYIGFHRLIITLSLLAGPTIASYIIDASDFKTWFISSFFIGMFSFGFMLFIKSPKILKNHKLDYLTGATATLKNKNLRIIFLGIALVSICYGILLTFVTLFVSKITDITNPGVYFTYFALASIIGNLSAGYLSDKLGRQIIVWPSIIFLGIGVASLALLPHNYLFLFVSSFMAGIGFAGGISALVAWLVDTAEKARKTTALAIQENVIDLFCALGSFTYGIISSWFGLGLAYALIGLIVVFSVLVILLYKRITYLKFCQNSSS